MTADREITQAVEPDGGLEDRFIKATVRVLDGAVMLYRVLVPKEPTDAIPRGAAMLEHGHCSALVYTGPSRSASGGREQRTKDAGSHPPRAATRSDTSTPSTASCASSTGAPTHSAAGSGTPSRAATWRPAITAPSAANGHDGSSTRADSPTLRASTPDGALGPMTNFEETLIATFRRPRASSHELRDPAGARLRRLREQGLVDAIGNSPKGWFVAHGSLARRAPVVVGLPRAQSLLEGCWDASLRVAPISS